MDVWKNIICNESFQIVVLEDQKIYFKYLILFNYLMLIHDLLLNDGLLNDYYIKN